MIGLVHKMKVTRITTPVDDSIGGAVVTGSVVYDSVQCRWDEEKPEMGLLQQGMEIPKLYTILAVPASLIIYELDEVELISPNNHQDANTPFVVRGVRVPSMHTSDRRGYLVIRASRKDYAHA